MYELRLEVLKDCAGFTRLHVLRLGVLENCAGFTRLFVLSRGFERMSWVYKVVRIK